MVGNTTFLIGAEDSDIPRVKEIIKKHKNKGKQKARHKK